MRRSGNFNLGSELLGNSSNDESPEDVSHDNQQRCAVAQCCRVSIRLQQKVNLVGHHRGMHPFRLRVQPDSCSAGFLLCSQLSNATGSHVPARSRTAAALIGPAHLLGLEFCTTLQCRFLKRSWPRSSAEPVCRRNGGLTRPRRTLGE